jgi:hypothetical protein
MSMEHWWNTTDMREPVPQPLCTHTSHIYWPWIEPGSKWYEASDQLPMPRHGLENYVQLINIIFKRSGRTSQRTQCASRIVNAVEGLNHFSGTFAKLRKATISFAMSACLSICLSVRKEHRGSHWMDFHENGYMSIFLKSDRKI